MTNESVQRGSFVSGLGQRPLLRAALVGAVVGAFGWVLMLAIQNWILQPVFCRSSDTSGICANTQITAWIIAYILASIAGLFMLIRTNTFRPLLVVLAAIITLWGIGLWFVALPWWVGLLWSAGLFALAYVLYTWTVSIQGFAVAAVTASIFVILLRILVSY